MKSIRVESGVELGLISIVVAFRLNAILASAVAGYTREEVPTEKNTSHALTASDDAVSAAVGMFSPNHTTSGLIKPLQVLQVGGYEESLLGPRFSQPKHLFLSIQPWNSITSVLPAR